MEKFTKMFLPVASFVCVSILFYYLGRLHFGIQQLTAIIITSFGYILWLIGRYNLGIYYSLLPKAEQIVSKGLYSKIRHPLYISQMLVLAGVIFYIGDTRLWWLFFMILIFQLYRIHQEEKVLLLTFANDYRQYKNNTWF